LLSSVSDPSPYTLDEDETKEAAEHDDDDDDDASVGSRVEMTLATTEMNLSNLCEGAVEALAYRHSAPTNRTVSPPPVSPSATATEDDDNEDDEDRAAMSGTATHIAMVVPSMGLSIR
jgi:hypothetical protein